MRNINRRHILQASFAGIALCALPVPAYAHRKKKAFSIIEWNANQKLLEITHTLHLHDAEQGLNQLGKITKPDLSSLRARAQLALYVSEHFSLTLGNHKPISLEILGAEIENSYAYVYQQVALTNRPKNLIVKNTLLQDIYLDQTNLVNIAYGNALKSLIFITGDMAKKVEL